MKIVLKTKSQIENKLLECNNAYLNKEFEIIDNIDNKKILTKNKYGICKQNLGDLYRGSAPSIKSAINKTSYCIEEFKDKVKNDKYDYSLVNYVGQKEKVKIICKEHGIFEQSPDSHKKGHGCPKCGIIKLSLGRSEILNRLKNNNVNYIESEGGINFLKDIIIITCEHGHEYTQRIIDRLNGNGCPVCANISRSIRFNNEKNIRNITQYIYFLEIINNEEIFYKIGVSKNVKKRVSDLKRELKCSINILYKFECDIFEAFNFENFIINYFKEYRYYPKIEFGGRTECFKENVLDKYNSMLGYEYEERMNIILYNRNITIEEYYSEAI